MTTEEKIEHLKDWLDIWLNWKLSTLGYTNQFWYFYTKLGIILSPNFRNDSHCITFEEHLKLIENKKK